MARALSAISVERAQDLAKPGKGRVWTSENGKYVHGIGDTQFTKVLQPGYTIVIKGEALPADLFPFVTSYSRGINGVMIDIGRMNRILGQHGRRAEVLVEDVRSERDAAGGRRGRHQAWKG